MCQNSPIVRGIFGVAALFTLLAGCVHQAPQNPVLSPLPGVSGMARVSEGNYLIVQDALIYEPDLPRIGLIKVTDDTFSYARVEVRDWLHAQGPSNDLEGVCQLPGAPNDFLLAESGYWQSQYGRIFHIEVQNGVATVKRVLQLPLIADNSEQQVGDNFEGIACGATNGGDVIVMIGERGGTMRYPRGILRWGTYSPQAGSLQWGGQTGIPITPPPVWPETGMRSISDLYLDTSGVLWGAAAIDEGDVGPFRSLVYVVGCYTGNTAAPVAVVANSPVWILDGIKVEGLSAGKGNGGLSVGAEDEVLGGAWRLLPSTPTRTTGASPICPPRGP